MKINQNKTINTTANCIDDEFIITSDGMVDCKVNLTVLYYKVIMQKRCFTNDSAKIQTRL